VCGRRDAVMPRNADGSGRSQTWVLKDELIQRGRPTMRSSPAARCLRPAPVPLLAVWGIRRVDEERRLPSTRGDPEGAP
jgi:hypothetical protein